MLASQLNIYSSSYQTSSDTVTSLKALGRDVDSQGVTVSIDTLKGTVDDLRRETVVTSLIKFVS